MKSLFSLFTFVLGRRSSAKVTASLVLFVFAPAIHAQVQPPEVEWEKTFNGIMIGDEYHAIQRSNDGGYIVTGNAPTRVDGWYTSRQLILKFDTTGKEEWRYTSNRIEVSDGSSIVQTKDDGFVAAGYIYLKGNRQDGEVYLTKVDATGKFMWQKTFGSPVHDLGRSIQATHDGGLIIAGMTDPSDPRSRDSNVYLVRTDSNGNLIPGWPKTYGGTDPESGSWVEQTNDGGYVVTGWTQSFGGGGKIYLLKTNASGVTEWQQGLGEEADNLGRVVKQTMDGGFVVVGNTPGFFDPLDSNKIYLTKTDRAGKVMWHKTYGELIFNQGYSVQQTHDEGYIVGGISGATTQFSYIAGDVYLIRTDPQGNLIWQNKYGGADIDECYQVLQTDDNGYLMLGWTVSSTTQSYGLYLVKLAPETPAFLDCNTNGTDDAQDIASGTSKDCNGNAIPDECDIAAKLSKDLNRDVIPDECQISKEKIRLHYFSYNTASPELSEWKELEPPYSEFNIENPTAILCHGWNCTCLNSIHEKEQNGQPGWVMKMAQAINEKIPDQVNILAWDWSNKAKSKAFRDNQEKCNVCLLPMLFPPPGAEAINQAQILCDNLNLLFVNRGYPTSKPIHFIGHSLGAHLVAWAGVRMLQSGKGYFPRQVTCSDPPEAEYHLPGQEEFPVVNIGLPDICVPFSYLRDSGKDIFTELYHGSVSLLAHNAVLWVNVPGWEHNIDWYLGTMSSDTDLALYQFMTYPAGRISGTVGFGASVVLPNGGNRPARNCEIGKNETMAFSTIKWPPFANGFNEWPFCRKYTCTCESESCQHTLNPEPIDLTNCICDPVGSCEAQVNRVVIHIPGKGIFKVTIRIRIKVNWYYFSFDCDFTNIGPDTDVSCIIQEGERREVVWNGSSDAYGGKGPINTGPIGVGDYRDRDVEMNFEVNCRGENGGDIIIANPVFSQDPSFGTPAPEVPPRLPDIPDVVLTNPGSSTSKVTLQCPPCPKPDQDITEYVWIVDGNYYSGEVTIDIELEIGIHVISLCLVDKFSQQTCAEKTVRVKGEYEFIRGDANGDGKIEITDAIQLFTYLFLDPNVLICSDAGDADDDGKIENDISDPIYILNFLFLGGPNPKPPYPTAGLDPTPDMLGCDIKPK